MNGSRTSSLGGRVLILGGAMSALLFQPGSLAPYEIKTLVLYLSAAALALYGTLWRESAIPFWTMAAFTALSAVWSAWPGLALEQATRWAAYATILAGAASLDDEARRMVLRAAVVVSIVAAGYAVVQWAGADPVRWDAPFGGRVFSSFGNPNFYAGYLVAIWPVAAHLSVSETRGRGWWLAATIANSLCLLLTGTRGAILAAVPLAGLFTVFQVPRQMRRWYAVGIAVLSVAVAGVWVAHAVRRDASLAERRFKWAVGMQMFSDRPVSGVGAGNLKVHFASYRSRYAGTARMRMKSSSESHVHSEYIQVLAETGLPGFCVFVSAFGLLLWRLGMEMSTAADPSRSPALAGLCALGGTLLYAASNFPLTYTPAGMALFSVVGSCLPREPRGAGIRHAGLRHAIGLVVSAALLVGSWHWGVRPVLAGGLAAQGLKLRAAGDIERAVKALERAARLDPHRAERALHELGETHRLRGDLRAARDAYERLARLRPSAETFNNIGNCRYLLGDAAGARAAWTLALELGMPDPADDERIRGNLRAMSDGSSPK